MFSPNIHSYVKQEESDFESDEVRVGENWYWNLRDHVQLIFHLKNSVFYQGENNWMRPFKNIMEPVLNLAYWTEDIEVKDVVFFIENRLGRALSFLVKKYHDEVYVKEHDLDTLFDEITESDIDYGGVLVQRTNKGRPEVLPLQTLAFCDQTDILGGPVGFKHTFSPGGLKKMAKFGWGDEANGATMSLEELITIADTNKDPAGMKRGKKNETPGKVIEVYIVRGDLPEHYLKDNNNMDDFLYQLHIIAYYTDKDNNKQGVTLYRKLENEGSIKFHTSQKVYARALGRGAGEVLLHPQIWSNFLTIHKTNLLEAASKVPLVTDDPNYHNRNQIQEMENLEITTIEDNKSIRQIPTAAPANINLYERSINEWYEQGQLAGSAFDPLLGKEQSSGTTFRGQERTVAQGRGLHDRRRGQRAKFIEEIYRDWIIPDIVKEIVKGKEFMATLSSEELRWVRDAFVTNKTNARIKKMFIEGDDLPTPEEQEQFKQFFSEEFARRGSKQMLKILKDEFKGIELKMGINIAGKQKDLANLSDKILSIFQFVFANPQGFQQAMQIPALSQSFNDILEFSNMNQSDFTSLIAATPPPVEQQAPQQAPAEAELQPNATL